MPKQRTGDMRHARTFVARRVDGAARRTYPRRDDAACASGYMQRMIASPDEDEHAICAELWELIDRYDPLPKLRVV